MTGYPFPLQRHDHHVVAQGCLSERHDVVDAEVQNDQKDGALDHVFLFGPQMTVKSRGLAEIVPVVDIEARRLAHDGERRGASLFELGLPVFSTYRPALPHFGARKRELDSTPS